MDDDRRPQGYNQAHTSTKPTVTPSPHHSSSARGFCTSLPAVSVFPGVDCTWHAPILDLILSLHYAVVSVPALIAIVITLGFSKLKVDLTPI